MKPVSYIKRTHGIIKTTSITVVTVDSKQDAEQLSLFAHDIWQNAMVSTMAKFREFYPSEIAQICDISAPHANAVGTLYRTLMRAGKIERTGLYRPSPRGSRNGSVEFQYRHKHLNLLA